MNHSLNWAVLGTGIIANEIAQALQKMGKSLYAVGNRTHEKAVKFAEKYGVHIVVQYYVTQINAELGEISDGISQIQDFQDNEYRSRVFSLVAHVKRLMISKLKF